MLSNDVDTARTKRQSVTVIFANYIMATDKIKCPFVFFEGKDDLGVWPIWFKTLGDINDVFYFPCTGKYKLLELRDKIEKNKATPPRKNFFFIDRDFDDLAGHSEGVDLFLTDRHSIENYFLDESVIVYALNSQFDCALALKSKERVVDTYKRMLSEFILHTTEINFRAFCIKKSKCNNEFRLPDKISDIVDVSEKWKIKPHKDSPSNIIKFPDEIGGIDIDQLRLEFSSLTPKDRFRGKFFFLFLNHFFKELQEDRKAQIKTIFCNDLSPTKIMNNGINLQSLASFSGKPLDLKSFLLKSNIINAA